MQPVLLRPMTIWSALAHWRFTALLFGALMTGVCVAVADPIVYVPVRGAAPAPLSPAGPTTPQEMEAFFDGWMAAQMSSKSIAGATVAVVKDGRLFFAKGYGFADVEKGIPVDPQRTLFRAGSISKLITWTAVMQLAEQGRLDLHSDVNRYLTDFKIPNTFPAPVTMINLMTHSAGFEDGGIGYVMAGSQSELLPLGKWLPLHMPARVRPPVRDFAQATGVAYSNWGAALAGHIVETVSGLSFDDYVERNILRPLGMNDSTFREPLPTQLATRLSGGYSEEEGDFVRHALELTHNLEPAASLSSTGADMARFMIACLQGGVIDGTRILRPESLQLMQTRAAGPDTHVNGLGLGYFETWINGRRIIGHGGDTQFFHSELELLPEANLGLFVSFNTSHTGGTAIDLMQTFYRHYFPARLPEVKPPPDASIRNARFAGTYRSLRRSYTKADKALSIGDIVDVEAMPDGTLSIPDPVLGKPMRWVEVGDGVFRARRADLFVAFKGNRDGSAAYLVGPEGDASADRMAWYETPGLHGIVIVCAALGFLSMLVSAIRMRRVDRENLPTLRWARPTLALAGGLLIGFALAALVAVANILAFFSGVPTLFYGALALPLLAIPFTGLAAYFAVIAWRSRAWTFLTRLHYTAVALAAIAFLVVLHYWNLIGYRLG